jgi:hypothetical protein
VNPARLRTGAAIPRDGLRIVKLGA